MKERLQVSRAKNEALNSQNSDVLIKKSIYDGQLSKLIHKDAVSADTDIDILANKLKIIELKKISKKMHRLALLHSTVVFCWQVKIFFSVALNLYLVASILLINGAIGDQIVLTMSIMLLFVVILTSPLTVIIGSMLEKLAGSIKDNIDNEILKFKKLYDA